MEEAIATIITQFGPQIWLAFVTFVVTGFVMLILKNLIGDLVLYFRVRMSDLGKGAMIMWWGKLKMVSRIYFKYIEVYDDEEVVYIPIKTWINTDRVYPKPREDQFDEQKWKHWDRITDRRKRNKLDPSESPISP